MKKLTPLLLMLALILAPVPRAALAQQQLADSAVVKIKTDIARRLRNEKSSVTIRLRNGSELRGRITQAAENMFTLKVQNAGAHV
jgi:sRNA-binding regulator protein Hfq